jgi:hypothetical protein
MSERPEAAEESNLLDVNERRYKILQVSPEFLVSLTKYDKPVTFEVFENALPQDAKLVGVSPSSPAFYFEGSRYVVALVVESESFEPVPVGVPLPFLNPPSFRVLKAEEVIDKIKEKLRCPKCGQETVETLDVTPMGVAYREFQLVCMNPDNCGWVKTEKRDVEK